MQQDLPTGTPTLLFVPSFYLIGHQPLRPGAIVSAAAAAVTLLTLLSHTLGRTEHAHLTSGSSVAARSPISPTGVAPAADDEDDPSQIDTVYLGDPADAPMPASPTDHVSSVHPTVVVHLPRFGDQVGLIPETPAGHLLYGWLSAFNKADYPALSKVLPTIALDSVTAAHIELRKQTGGFTLLSAKEIQPGVLIFRLRDQTRSANEVLGTLQVRPNSSPAAIASMSLRALPSSQQNTEIKDAPVSTNSP